MSSDVTHIWALRVPGGPHGSLLDLTLTGYERGLTPVKQVHHTPLLGPTLARYERAFMPLKHLQHTPLLALFCAYKNDFLQHFKVIPYSVHVGGNSVRVRR